jgi:hypothetical protein
MPDIKNQYNKTQQLSEGVYVIEDGNGSWGGEVNHNFELLNSILAKKTLTITQGDEVLGSYNAKEDSTINIPKSENFNLTFKSGDSVIGSFDNSQDVEIDLPSGNVVNKTLTITQGDEVLGTFDNSQDVEIEIPKGNKTLTIKSGDSVIGSFDNSQDVEIEIPEVSGGAKKIFTKKSPFVELHFTEPFLTDVLGYESVEQALEWLPYRNSVKVDSMPFSNKAEIGRELDSVFYKDIDTIYKGEHSSSYYVGEHSIFENNVDRDDYSKLENSKKIYYLAEKYRVLGDTFERVFVEDRNRDLSYTTVENALDGSYSSMIYSDSDLENLVLSSLGETEYIIHVYAFGVSNENFNISTHADLHDFWYSFNANSVEERIEQFNRIVQNTEGIDAHIDFRVFDKSKIVPEYFDSTKTHVFRFISNKNNITKSSGSYSTIFLYPNDNGMYHVKGNTNVKTNAYVVGASFENKSFADGYGQTMVGPIDITDTINDDLEETFKEVYNL